MSEALKLDTNVQPLDERACVKVAESALEKYRRFMLSIDDEYLPKVTPTYSLIPPSQTNEFSSSTENVIEFIDREREREQYVKLMWKAINRLSRGEYRELIIKRFMGREELYDFEVYNEMGVSKATYDRKKKRALVDLACALELEVYK